jgi:drug/metabolite transporter (DMT)-like permease
MATDRRTRTLAGISLAVACFCWSLPPLLIRLLSDAYDPMTLSFARYLWATVVLVPMALLVHRADTLRSLRRVRHLVPLGVFMVVQQYIWTVACYGANPVVAQLVTKLTIVFVIVFAFILFREERGVIRSPAYLLGTAVSLVGLVAVLADEPGEVLPGFNIYSGLLLLTALAWAIYTIWARHLVLDANPLAVYAVISLYTGVGLGVLSVAFFDISTLFTPTPRVLGLTIVAGVVPLAIGHPAFHFAQKHLGAAFSTSTTLSIPLLTYIIALVVLPGTTLFPLQWAGGFLLTGGMLLVIRAQQKRPVSAPVETAE